MNGVLICLGGRRSWARGPGRLWLRATTPSANVGNEVKIEYARLTHTVSYFYLDMARAASTW
eukprot:5370470-Lingulodinium_polyedra.AAC.1